MRFDVIDIVESWAYCPGWRAMNGSGSCVA